MHDHTVSRRIAWYGTARHDMARRQCLLFDRSPGQGEAVLVDNYRCAHGRDGYSDLSRAMWQIWVWSIDCLADAMPSDPGEGRVWIDLQQQQQQQKQQGQTTAAAVRAEGASAVDSNRSTMDGQGEGSSAEAAAGAAAAGGVEGPLIASDPPCAPTSSSSSSSSSCDQGGRSGGGKLAAKI
jgi:hypothetical protein